MDRDTGAYVAKNCLAIAIGRFGLWILFTSKMEKIRFLFNSRDGHGRYHHKYTDQCDICRYFLSDNSMCDFVSNPANKER